jgi:hypothetical protein
MAEHSQKSYDVANVHFYASILAKPGIKDAIVVRITIDNSDGEKEIYHASWARSLLVRRLMDIDTSITHTFPSLEKVLGNDTIRKINEQKKSLERYFRDFAR